MASIKYEQAAIVSLLTTELNSVASAGRAIAGTAYANNANQYLFGLFELAVTFGTAPTAGNTVDLYLIPAADGTNFADSTSTSVDPPLTTYVGSFPVRAVTTIQRVTLFGAATAGGLITIPPVAFKAFVINKSGQAFPASGSTLKMVPFRYQVQ